MKVLVINTGSSSIKYKLFDMEKVEVLAAGVVERIGLDDSSYKHSLFKNNEVFRSSVDSIAIRSHKDGLKAISNILVDENFGAINDHSEINVVGHRVVHGGEAFQQPTVITKKVIAEIEKNIALAPLHNPQNLNGITVAQKVFSKARHVAVFDTAFHQTMPQYSYMYAIPYDMYEQKHIRRYGFHGTSHNFVAHEAASFLKKRLEEINLITVHLGNGSSMAAVKKGICIDTTMGMTPLAGLIMGTRCGDLDPAVVPYLSDNNKCTIQEIDELLNNKSGLLGICGFSDMRQIVDEIAAGNKKAQLAVDMLTYRIKKYIGAYMVALGTVDAIVFTAGIGENVPLIRKLSCENLENFGIVLDNQLNAEMAGSAREINTAKSKVKILIVPTDEELQIARESYELVLALLARTSQSVDKV